MKKILLSLLPGVLLLSIGCSKKDEERAAVIPISDAYQKGFDTIQTGGYSLKEVASIREASMSAQQKAKKLGELKLTDEQLIALQTSTAKQYEQAGAMLTEMAAAFSAAATAAGANEQATKGFDKIKAGVNDACEAKEKSRRKKKKKKKECKKITAELENIPAGLTAEKIPAAIDALGGLKMSFDDVKGAVDKLTAALKAQIEAGKALAEAQKKADAFKAKLAQQKTQDAEGAKKLKAYCAPE